MAASVTVTGKIGAGQTLTAKTFTNITSFKIDPDLGLLELANSSGTVTAIAISDATTMTVTISGKTYTVTIS